MGVEEQDGIHLKMVRYRQRKKRTHGKACAGAHIQKIGKEEDKNHGINYVSRDICKVNQIHFWESWKFLGSRFFHKRG